MDEEVKLLFQMAYLPVAHANQRLNGGDFLSVAIPLMDELRKQNPNEVLLKRAARTIVLEFDNMLNPQMSVNQIDEFIQMVYSPGQLTRMMAEKIAKDFARKFEK